MLVMLETSWRLMEEIDEREEKEGKSFDQGPSWMMCVCMFNKFQVYQSFHIFLTVLNAVDR